MPTKCNHCWQDVEPTPEGTCPLCNVFLSANDVPSLQPTSEWRVIVLVVLVIALVAGFAIFGAALTIGGIGGLLLLGGVGLMQGPKEDRRFRTGYKDNQLPNPRQQAVGIGVAVVGGVLLWLAYQISLFK